MMEQMDIFATEADRLRELELKRMFREWKSLPPETLVPARDPQRSQVKTMLAAGYCFLWEQALHRCPGLPDDKYIWLNEIEPAEYWVMNDSGNPAGEHIDTCPFCGANLKAGGGDVLLVKADGGWWVVNGFLNESG